VAALAQRNGEQLLGRHRFLNELYKSLVFERFCEKGEGAGIERGLARRRIVAPRDENDSRLRRVSPETNLHFQTVHLGHPYVEDRDTTCGMFESCEKGNWVVKLFCNKTGRA